MQFKRFGSKIFGVQLNKAEQKAMDAEINRQILEHDESFAMDNDAAILWTLHVCFGFGEKRLKKFWDCCFKEHQRLRDYYQLEPEDDGWLYRRKLKEIGVDIEALYKNMKGGTGQ